MLALLAYPDADYPDADFENLNLCIEKYTSICLDIVVYLNIILKNNV